MKTIGYAIGLFLALVLTSNAGVTSVNAETGEQNLVPDDYIELGPYTLTEGGAISISITFSETVADNNFEIPFRCGIFFQLNDEFVDVDFTGIGTLGEKQVDTPSALTQGTVTLGPGTYYLILGNSGDYDITLSYTVNVVASNAESESTGSACSILIAPFAIAPVAALSLLSLKRK